MAGLRRLGGIGLWTLLAVIAAAVTASLLGATGMPFGLLTVLPGIAVGVLVFLVCALVSSIRELR